MAKNIVAAGLARRCEVQVAYAIGVAKPVSLMVNTFGTGRISDEEIAQLVPKYFDLRPAAIIRDLDPGDRFTSRLQLMAILVEQTWIFRGNGRIRLSK